MNYQQIWKSLQKLVDTGFLLSLKQGGNIYFINASNINRLDYVVQDIKIVLEDSLGQGLFERHSFRMKIMNDTEQPLFFIQFRAGGDIERSKQEVSFSALDLSAKGKSKIYFIADDPLEKRIIIEFSSPILPHERKTILIEYFWPEPEFYHSFTASTDLKSMRFSLISKSRFIMSVSRTNSGRTETRDESERVVTSSGRGDKIDLRFETKNLPRFALLNFKWKRVKDKIPNQKNRNLIDSNEAHI